MTVSGNLATEHRLAWIRERLDREGQIRIGEVAIRLAVSEMTIRRDLQELEALGSARRVRGGAVAVSVGPIAFAERHRSNARAKAKIAAKLAALVPTTGAIGLDASSTLLRLANSLDGARDLVVLTNGWETFSALQDKPGVRAVLTGGELDPRTGSLVGAVAGRAAATLLLTRLFVSAASVDPQFGASEPCMEEAEVKRFLASVAGDVVLAADHSKFGASSIARSLDWADVSVFVTDLDPSDRRLDPYRDVVELR